MTVLFHSGGSSSLHALRGTALGTQCLILEVIDNSMHEAAKQLCDTTVGM